MATQPEPLPTAAEPDALIGKVIDRYQVVSKIGEGGMGAVYRVEHVMLKKNMAMKLLRFELSQHQELVARFQNEAIAASRIGQENIVAVTDFGRTAEGLVYFVMEELQGAPLSLEIHRNPGFPVSRAISIAAQSCRALHAAHNAGIIHRDLKPENIILTTREEFADFVKILDFGISKMSEFAGPQQSGRDGQRLTRAGMIVGTPEYMSPEQAAGRGVDARSDIYSLGIVLYEMLSGRLPFEADNPIAMLMRHQTAPVPAFSSLVPGLIVPAKLERVVRRALSKLAEDRPQSMAELLNELQDCAERLDLTQPALRLPAPRTPAPALLSSPGERIPQQDTLPPSMTPARGQLGAERSPGAAEMTDEETLVAAGLAPNRRGRRVGILVVVGALTAVTAIALGGRILGSKTTTSPAVSAPPPSAQLPQLPSVPVEKPREVAPAAAVPAIPDPAAVAAPTPQAEVPPPPPPVRSSTNRPKRVRSAQAPAAAPPAGPKATPASTVKAPEPDPYQKVDELKKPY